MRRKVSFWLRMINPFHGTPEADIPPKILFRCFVPGEAAKPLDSCDRRL